MRKKFHSIFLFSLLNLLSLTSCEIYKQDFDCPPPCGMSRTSETDLESMVIETDKGSDLFIPEDKESNCSCRKCRKAKAPHFLNRKVWICHHLTEEGCEIQGHYIYQTIQTTPFSLEYCDLEDSKIQFIPSKR